MLVKVWNSLDDFIHSSKYAVWRVSIDGHTSALIDHAARVRAKSLTPLLRNVISSLDIGNEWGKFFWTKYISLNKIQNLGVGH